MGRKRTTPREIRLCASSGCKVTFECRATNVKKYCKLRCYWKNMRGRKHTEAVKKKIGASNTGKKKSEEAKKKQSERLTKLWQTPRYISNQMKARYICPNKPEKFLNNLLRVLFPNQWEFVGDGRFENFIIGGKVPDFAAINGRKKLIELFGDYYHGESMTGISRKHHEQERVAHFTKYGYQTLIIWEHELKDIETLKSKLRGNQNG